MGLNQDTNGNASVGNAAANLPGENPPSPWDQLMDVVGQENVVPVIGSEVYLDNNNVLLYESIARAINHGASPDKHVFHKAAGTYLARTLRPNYAGLNNIVRNAVAPYAASDFPWITLIASVSKFKIYINTTYDNLLERALIRAGRAVKRVNYMPWYRTDMGALEKFQEHLKKDNGVVLFNAFGTFVDPRPCYSENDLIELVNSLTIDMKSNNLFFTKVAQSSNLFIGCSYKNWLMRFVSWSVPATPYAPGLEPPKRFFTKNIVSDDNDDRDLVSFFESKLGYETFLLGSPVQFLSDFMREVSTRNWFADNHNCFINFDGAQRTTAQQLFDELSVDVKPWMDSHAMQQGNQVSKVIKDKILYANVFIAIVTSQYDDNSYQAREINWLENYSESERTDDDKIIVMTIAIGDLDKNTLPAILKSRFWLSLPDSDLLNPEVKAEVDQFIKSVKENICK